jgi:hypothetical protein
MFITGAFRAIAIAARASGAEARVIEFTFWVKY